MFSFNNYKNEIRTISAVNNVDLGVAFDMFRADVRAGQALPYNTGNALPNFDFTIAKSKWDALTRDEQNAVVIDYKE